VDMGAAPPFLRAVLYGCVNVSVCLGEGQGRQAQMLEATGGPMAAVQPLAAPFPRAAARATGRAHPRCS
jgi:hypothetical protein